MGQLTYTNIENLMTEWLDGVVSSEYVSQIISRDINGTLDVLGEFNREHINITSEPHTKEQIAKLYDKYINLLLA